MRRKKIEVLSKSGFESEKSRVKHGISSVTERIIENVAPFRKKKKKKLKTNVSINPHGMR